MKISPLEFSKLRQTTSFTEECDFLRAWIWIWGRRAKEGSLKPAPGTWQLSWLLMLRGFSDPKIPPCISLLFLSFFAEICHIAQGPSSRQGATMYNPTENKSPRSNTAQLLKQASEPRRHGAVLRPSETLWRLWFSNPSTNSAVLPFNASQPVLTFSLFKHCWTLLALDRGRVGLDNDMPYATLPLQLSEPCMDQLRHKSIWNLILLS